MKLNDLVQTDILSQDYEQLIGAMGCLVSAGELQFSDDMVETLKRICRDVDHGECSRMLKEYRSQCLAKKLIKPGHLFNRDHSDILTQLNQGR